jgi:hypothetical protein
VLGDEMHESARSLSKFSLEGEVAPCQLLLVDGSGHERLLELTQALFRGTQSIRELSLRAAKERIPSSRCGLGALPHAYRLGGCWGPSRWLRLEVRRVLAEECVRRGIPRDRPIAQSSLSLDGLGRNRHFGLCQRGNPLHQSFDGPLSL